jgi:exosome complex component RRP43
LGNTAVVCGVRAEILKAEDISSTDDYGAEAVEEDLEREREEIAGLRLLVPNVELSTGSTPLLLPGNAPSTFAQTLVTRIRNLLLSTNLVSAPDLRILYRPSTKTEDSEQASESEIEVKGYWVLYIDTVFLSLDGNAFDAAWLAIIAALRDAMIPKAFFDEELETILCSDDPSEASRLTLRGLPVPSTFAVFQSGSTGNGEDKDEDWVLSDPDAFEEGICRETICVVVDCSDTKGRRRGKANDAVIRKIEKSGGGVVDRVVMKGLIRRSVERWNVWESVLSGKA